MKWKESDFKTGISKVRALLVYGPDAGQADEYCDRAVEVLGIEKDNLFVLDADDLVAKQEALFAESCTPSMFGGQRMVIISNAGDPIRYVDGFQFFAMDESAVAYHRNGTRDDSVVATCY